MEGQSKAPSATKAIVFAILSFFVCPLICSILAIVYGNATMREIRESGGMLGGEFEGRFAQVVGWLTLVVIPLMALAILSIAYLGNS